jgi:hypothetical protein
MIIWRDILRVTDKSDSPSLAKRIDKKHDGLDAETCVTVGGPHGHVASHESVQRMTELCAGARIFQDKFGHI